MSEAKNTQTVTHTARVEIHGEEYAVDYTAPKGASEEELKKLKKIAIQGLKNWVEVQELSQQKTSKKGTATKGGEGSKTRDVQQETSIKKREEEIFKTFSKSFEDIAKKSQGVSSSSTQQQEKPTSKPTPKPSVRSSSRAREISVQKEQLPGKITRQLQQVQDATKALAEATIAGENEEVDVNALKKQLKKERKELKNRIEVYEQDEETVLGLEEEKITEALKEVDAESSNDKKAINDLYQKLTDSDDVLYHIVPKGKGKEKTKSIEEPLITTTTTTTTKPTPSTSAIEKPKPKEQKVEIPKNIQQQIEKTVAVMENLAANIQDDEVFNEYNQAFAEANGALQEMVYAYNDQNNKNNDVAGTAFIDKVVGQQDRVIREALRGIEITGGTEQKKQIDEYYQAIFKGAPPIYDQDQNTVEQYYKNKYPEPLQAQVAKPQQPTTTTSTITSQTRELSNEPLQRQQQPLNTKAIIDQANEIIAIFQSGNADQNQVATLYNKALECHQKVVDLSLPQGMKESDRNRQLTQAFAEFNEVRRKFVGCFKKDGDYETNKNKLTLLLALQLNGREQFTAIDQKDLSQSEKNLINYEIAEYDKNILYAMYLNDLDWAEQPLTGSNPQEKTKSLEKTVGRLKHAQNDASRTDTGLLDAFLNADTKAVELLNKIKQMFKEAFEWIANAILEYVNISDIEEEEVSNEQIIAIPAQLQKDVIDAARNILPNVLNPDINIQTASQVRVLEETFINDFITKLGALHEALVVDTDRMRQLAHIALNKAKIVVLQEYAEAATSPEEKNRLYAFCEALEDHVKTQEAGEKRHATIDGRFFEQIKEYAKSKPEIGESFKEETLGEANADHVSALDETIKDKLSAQEIISECNRINEETYLPPAKEFLKKLGLSENAAEQLIMGYANERVIVQLSVLIQENKDNDNFCNKLKGAREHFITENQKKAAHIQSDKVKNAPKLLDLNDVIIGQKEQIQDDVTKAIIQIRKSFTTGLITKKAMIDQVMQDLPKALNNKNIKIDESFIRELAEMIVVEAIAEERYVVTAHDRTPAIRDLLDPEEPNRGQSEAKAAKTRALLTPENVRDGVCGNSILRGQLNAKVARADALRNDSKFQSQKALLIGSLKESDLITSKEYKSFEEFAKDFEELYPTQMELFGTTLELGIRLASMQSLLGLMVNNLDVKAPNANEQLQEIRKIREQIEDLQRTEVELKQQWTEAFPEETYRDLGNELFQILRLYAAAESQGYGENESFVSVGPEYMEDFTNTFQGTNNFTSLRNVLTEQFKARNSQPIDNKKEEALLAAPVFPGPADHQANIARRLQEQEVIQDFKEMQTKDRLGTFLKRTEQIIKEEYGGTLPNEFKKYEILSSKKDIGPDEESLTKMILNNDLPNRQKELLDDLDGPNGIALGLYWIKQVEEQYYAKQEMEKLTMKAGDKTYWEILQPMYNAVCQKLGEKLPACKVVIMEHTELNDKDVTF